MSLGMAGLRPTREEPIIVTTNEGDAIRHLGESYFSAMSPRGNSTAILPK